MTRTAFYRELESTLEAEPNSIDGNSVLSELEGFDSLGVMALLAMADEQFGVIIAPEDLTRCETVDDLVPLFGGQIQD